MKIALIAAMGANRVIGVDNRMPWHLSADLKRFRQITMGKPILMGRKTHESIGRPLPGRTNLVLTANPAYAAAGCVVVHSLEEAARAAEGEAAEELMVIGGAALYRECLPRADRLHLTLIHRAFAGDTFFPEFEPGQWRETAREDIERDPDSGLGYSFVTLERAD
ncbi:dihydrofolate reductase [Methylomagnum ishizawai]|uniref:dihydrofolate reductase n=1 Tax=Methylomagnum ishizawai TaxID=1760988 RepID=UPI001C3339A9|nr:dihydrofolate reductase [Methylomagnum ishizawai]BBL73567.1 dihydrofolate reductase [Methylomagnum ishizawai]